MEVPGETRKGDGTNGKGNNFEDAGGKLGARQNTEKELDSVTLREWRIEWHFGCAINGFDDTLWRVGDCILLNERNISIVVFLMSFC